MSALYEAYPNLQHLVPTDLIDYEAQAIEFLTALAGPEYDIESEPFCFQIIPNTSRESLPDGILPAAATHRTGTWKFCRRWLRSANSPEHGGLCGVYVCVNKTDGQGRKKQHVTSVRALFIELDHGGITKAHISEFVDRFQPSIVVESSPGKIHVYWLLRDQTCPLEKFSACQLLLAQRFQGLRAGMESKDLPRVLRVPGFLHLKDLSSPFWVSLRHCDSSLIYTADDVFRLCEIGPKEIQAWQSSPANKGASGVVASEVRATVDPRYNEFLGAAEGNRNEALYHYCSQHLLRHRGLNHDEALAALQIVNRRNSPPVPDSELEALALSAWKRFESIGAVSSLPPGVAQTMLSEWKPDRKAKEIPSGYLVPDSPESFEENSFQFNYARADMACVISDAALADRIIQKYGSRINYSSTGGFFVYNDLIWSNSNGSGEAMLYSFMRQTFPNVVYEPPVQDWFVGPKNTVDMPRFMTFKRDVQSLNRFTAVSRLLSKNSDLLVTHDSFNTEAEADYLAAPNGVIDLRSGELLSPDPRFRLTHTIACGYDVDADCPTWDYFIASAMGGDEDLIAYMQRVTGYFLSGRTHLQALFVAFGIGGSGKSVYLSVLGELLRGYHTELHKNTLIASKTADNAKMSSLAQAMHCRFATVQEMSEKDIWDESLVKQISGNDEIVAKLSHKDTVRFRPRFKVCVRANQLPTSDQLDEAMWERLRFLPFQVKFRRTAQEDPFLFQKLCGELPGILNWAIRGYRSLIVDGLNEPTVAVAQKESLQLISEPVRSFIADYCEQVPEHKLGMKFAEFISAYQVYCRDAGSEFENSRAIRRYLLEQTIYSEKNARMDNSSYPVKMIDIQVKEEHKPRFRVRNNVVQIPKK